MDFNDAYEYVKVNGKDIGRRAISGDVAALAIIQAYQLVCAASENGLSQAIFIGAVEAYKSYAEHPIYRRG